MEDGATGQPRSTTPEDLHRLAALAHTRGLRLNQESDTVWFCSSASQHTDPHYVTGLSCDCRGFQEHQRCTHYALLLDHLGWLPEVEPTPASAPALTSCANCSGGGVIVYRSFEERCPNCQGTGEVPAVAGLPLAA
jgi:DnaJ-class molecular chaperone